jgi:hypothetical protein
VEVGKVDWFIYDGVNYLDAQGGKGSALKNLFVNFKFWGDSGRGAFLRFQNAMTAKDKMSNKFAYEVKSPEKSFERYLDDMGALIVNFFDTEKNQTVGTSKVILKLYIKR